jgi:hypothetical protein
MIKNLKCSQVKLEKLISGEPSPKKKGKSIRIVTKGFYVS